MRLFESCYELEFKAKSKTLLISMFYLYRICHISKILHCVEFKDISSENVYNGSCERFI